MTLVPFYPGNGEEIMIDVNHISEFPRDAHGLCAFCHGDPCDEEKQEGTMIHLYWESMKGHYCETCPCCDGRPS